MHIKCYLHDAVTEEEPMTDVDTRCIPGRPKRARFRTQTGKQDICDTYAVPDTGVVHGAGEILLS